MLIQDIFVIAVNIRQVVGILLLTTNVSVKKDQIARLVLDIVFLSFMNVTDNNKLY